jgi:putative SOS response-associated peptidase YedK
MGFASLWDVWKDPTNGSWVQSFTIMTTDANEVMTPIRTRMPVIPYDYGFGLDGTPSGACYRV